MMHSVEGHSVFLGLGANIGERKQTLLKAIDLINQAVGPVESQSSFYETKPWGFVSSHPFVNACICCCTKLAPRQVLNATQKIEKQLGRTEKSVGSVYHDRVIDIDILLYDDLKLNEPDLKIPHPLMYDREFVMEPLCEIMEK